MSFTVETCVAQHIGDRAEQQDRVGLFTHPTRPEILLAILADGMGGHSGGAMAAEQVVIKGRQDLDVFAPRHETAEQLLGSVLADAHTVIRLTRFTSEQDPHSTAVVLLLQGDMVTWAHCGDSRLYHFRGPEIVARTEDHSLVGELQRQGRLDEHQARSHPQRNVLLSCLGSDREPRIEYGHARQLAEGNSFLLCSDGLWAYFSDDELAQTVHEHSARAAAETLIGRARERAAGGGDNISLAIVKLVPAPKRLFR
ncbi:PP2C family protein-serine/threonine phosphatase [Thauera sinica]|uniref:PP2C family protein-serine/threonine phosphatase n=1 Tax=Thauera sinica TaxID=2665146 RepID=A0ABW1AL87_9RHOO|nr:protein phosphatase 2C domain-containing protein [Thauera sp. K11]ATE59131.1 serine/threonine protein phosphatase [Thauera sp. K11]